MMVVVNNGIGQKHPTEPIRKHQVTRAASLRLRSGLDEAHLHFGAWAMRIAPEQAKVWGLALEISAYISRRRKTDGIARKREISCGGKGAIRFRRSCIAILRLEGYCTYRSFFFPPLHHPSIYIYISYCTKHTNLGCCITPHTLKIEEIDE